MLFSVLTLVLRCCDAAAVVVVGSRLSLHLSLGRECLLFLSLPTAALVQYTGQECGSVET